VLSFARFGDPRVSAALYCPRLSLSPAARWHAALPGAAESPTRTKVEHRIKSRPSKRVLFQWPRTDVYDKIPDMIGWRLIRRIALAMIVLVCFAQTALAFTPCAMDSADMAQMMSGGDDCCGQNDIDRSAPTLTAGCLAHCTADAQTFGFADMVIAASSDPVLFVPRARRKPWMDAAYRPPSDLPRRILLHSFLI
jgi:hypothetical protein